MAKHPIHVAPLVCMLLLTACAIEPTRDHTVHESDAVEQPYEAMSLLGRPLKRPELTPDRREELAANLAEAIRAAEADPHDEMAAIWHGRRLAYLSRYNDAIEVYSQALAKHPESYKLLRHRGHRYITTRRFDLASNDLYRAANLSSGYDDEIEPDGAPNALGIPTSTTKSNIFYHLGLALYLRGEFESALEAYRQCMLYSTANDDMFCATSYWLYLTLLRLDRVDEAAQSLEPIREDMDIIENHAYHRLLRLFRGELTPGDVLEGVETDSIANPTSAYGIAIWLRSQGEVERADAMLQEIVESPTWPAFGFIAAEADLARRGPPAR